MKKMGAFVLWVLTFSKLVTTGSSLNADIFSEIPELSDLCPFTSFCEENTSLSNTFSDDYTPCCRPCSCQPECGYRGNCCFSYQDILHTVADPPVVCKSSLLVEPSYDDGIPDVSYYRMINKCMVSNTSCEHITTETEGSFHPVISRSTQYVYINGGCALCNHVTDTVPWNKAISCSTHNSNLPPLSDSIVEGRKPSGCQVYFYPPEGFLVYPDYSCSPVIKRTCPGNYNQTTLYKDLCLQFNATFIVNTKRSHLVYANVFCYMCSLWTVGAAEKQTIQQQCLNTGYLYTPKFGSGFRLTVLLDSNSSNNHAVTSGTNQLNNVCPENNVLVQSFTRECRLLRCPWGQLRLNSRCDYFSKMWIGGPFTMMLRLTPIGERCMVPIELFQDMLYEMRSEKNAQWIKRKTLLWWNFVVFYHPCSNGPFVDYLVARATYPSQTIDPKYLETVVRRTLQDTWNVDRFSYRIKFKVEFNDYLQYHLLFPDEIEEFNIRVTDELTYMPSWVFCKDEYISEYQYTVLHPVSVIPTTNINEVLSEAATITKLLLCDQVRLLHEEFNYTCNFINFTVHNKMIHAFTLVESSDSNQVEEYPNHSSKDKLTVSVCVQEFEHAMNHWSPLTLSNVLLYMYTSISLMYII